MKPLLGKTHLHGDVLGHHVAEGKVKVVMWFMDPRQVLVNYHHTMSTMACKMLGWEPVDWNTFHEAYKQHQMLEGDWFDFVRSWQPYFNCSNVLMLFYEDVAKDLVGTVKRIADFCGKNLSEDALSKIASCKPFDEPGRDPYKVFTPDQMKEFNVRFTSEMSGTEFEMRYPPKWECFQLRYENKDLWVPWALFCSWSIQELLICVSCWRSYERRVWQSLWLFNYS